MFYYLWMEASWLLPSLMAMVFFSQGHGLPLTKCLDPSNIILVVFIWCFFYFYVFFLRACSFTVLFVMYSVCWFLLCCLLQVGVLFCSLRFSKSSNAKNVMETQLKGDPRSCFLLKMTMNHQYILFGEPLGRPEIPYVGGCGGVCPPAFPVSVLAVFWSFILSFLCISRQSCCFVFYFISL